MENAFNLKPLNQRSDLKLKNLSKKLTHRLNSGLTFKKLFQIQKTC
jgi:hypothetical protein